MRRITKGQEPGELRRWKEAEVPQNLTYDNMPKGEVKRQMLEDFVKNSLPTATHIV